MKITNFSNHAYCLPSSHSFLPTKYLVAEAVGSLGQGSRSKLNCNLKSLHKMARFVRAASNHHPANPTSLEDLVLPNPYITATSGEPLLLWDSGYSTELWQSFLFRTPQNTSVLMDADHFMIDGTFKTSLDRIDSAWRFLKPLIPADMDDFVNYFERTWIGTSTQGPRFEHSKWNHYDDIQPLLPRSSNIVEGWHHGFHSMMGCTYPTIWKFHQQLFIN